MAANKEKNYNVRVPKIPGEHKTWTFTLSLSGMITAVGTVCVVLALFFILGLLVGRGYQPEQSVPHLADIMPSNHGAANATKAPAAKVLKVEDLTYPETLAKAPKQVGQTADEPSKKTPAPKKATAAKPTQKQAKSTTTAQQAPRAGQKIYDYVYQVASFRKQDMADSLSNKLSGAGLNAAIESAATSKGKWFRVVVKHRGTPDSTSAMKSALAKFGISRPLMKRKKLVSSTQ